MTYEQYWYGDPLMVRAFYKAEKIRQERMNDEAWLNGVYVLKALEATVGNLMKQKNDEKNKYPEKPISINGEKPPEAKPEQQEENEKAFAKAYMLQMVQAGKSWGKK